MAPPSLPPGFRFHPTDEELVAYYLKRKCCGAQFYSDIIGELDLYKYEPWDLPGLSLLPSRDQQWYFFNLRDKKYPHSSRTNRATGTGYWKATGKDRIVLSGTCKIGMKKTLVFYIGRAPQGERTDWIMHEYRLSEDYEIAKAIAGSYVVCRIYKKSGLGPRNGEQYGAPVEEGDDPIEDMLPGIEVDGNEQGSLVHMSSEIQLISNKSNILKETHAKKSSFPEVIGHVDNPFGKFVSNKSVDNLLKSLLQEDPNEIQHADLILNGWDMDLNLQNGLIFQKQDMNFQILNSPFVPNQTKLDIDCANNFDDIHNILHPLADEEEMLEELLFQAEYKPSMDLKLASETKNAHAPEPLDYDDILKGDFLELADLEIPCIHPSTTLPHREEWPIMFEHPGYLFGPTDNVSHGYIQDGYSFHRGATIQSPEMFECATKGDLLYGAPNNSESQESHQLGNTVSSITSANGKNPNLEVRTSSNASFQMCTELKLPHLSKISSNFDEALMQTNDKQPRSENCCLSNMPVLLERPHYNVA